MPEGDRVFVTQTVVRSADGADLPAHSEKRTCQQQFEEELKTIAKTAFYTSVVHPFNYAQLLMQIGYEPLPVRPGKDMFGKPVYYLASVFDYIHHIRKQNGFRGLYFGLGSTLAVTIGGVYAYRGAERLVTLVYDEWYMGRPADLNVKRFGFLEPSEGSRNVLSALRFEPKEMVGITYTASHFIEDFLKEVSIMSITMAVIWPLEVISFRTLAQFVGGEKLYDGLVGSVREILNTEGLAGFYRGFFPIWYSYVSITTVTYVTVFAYASYNTVNPINLRLIAAAAGAIANSIFYPLKLTARLFAISGARIAAARPPRMPTFAYWRDLHSYLLASGEGKRGSSMIFRKVGVKLPGSLVLNERSSGAAAYRSHSVRGEDWSEKHTSTQLLQNESHYRGFVF